MNLDLKDRESSKMPKGMMARTQANEESGHCCPQCSHPRAGPNTSKHHLKDVFKDKLMGNLSHTEIFFFEQIYWGTVDIYKGHIFSMENLSHPCKIMNIFITLQFSLHHFVIPTYYSSSPTFSKQLLICFLSEYIS